MKVFLSLFYLVIMIIPISGYHDLETVMSESILRHKTKMDLIQMNFLLCEQVLEDDTQCYTTLFNDDYFWN